MSWRTVVISQRSKLELRLNHLVVRQADKTTKIFIGEIGVLIIESTAVVVTSALLHALTKEGVKVIFCDEKHNPSSELIPYYGSHDNSKKIVQQINWKSETCNQVWTEIIKEKIFQQAQFLDELGLEEAGLVKGYIDNVVLGDITNREGHAAKVYFNALFGMDFHRHQDCSVNAALNYGYAIILSAINREISANGYLTQKGINHRAATNPFNLGSDLIEPWRVLIDRYVYNKPVEKFDVEEKRELVNILNRRVKIHNKKQTVLNGIKIYCRSVFNALNRNEPDKIRFYRNEL